MPISMNEDPDVAHRELDVAFPNKPLIKCLYSGKNVDDLVWIKTALIFTHGAGGTLKADAVVNFTHGFVTSSAKPTLLCFQGNMNLASRIKMFKAILEAREAELKPTIKTGPACLGGRSMGARAAVMAATAETTHLVLISYPLHTGKESRDQILLDLPASIKVIFISGDLDHMCDLTRLETVRRKMKCKTWKAVVNGADHGMNVKPKSGTQEVGRMTGAIVATWQDDSNERLTEGTVSWDSDEAAAKWSGWSEPQNLPKTAAASTETGKASAKPTKFAATPSKRKSNKTVEKEQDIEITQTPEPRKRRKI